MVTTLNGADDWQVMEDLANSMNDWIGQFVDISTGIPNVAKQAKKSSPQEIRASGAMF